MAFNKIQRDHCIPLYIYEYGYWDINTPVKGILHLFEVVT